MAELSVFGNLASGQSMKYLIDSRSEKFNQPWYINYFDWDIPQINLDFTTVLGESVISVAASIVARDAETPLRSRAALAKLTGEIPAIKQMLTLNENQYRNYRALQSMQGVSDTQRRDQALKLVWDDVKKSVDSIHNRLDLLCLQAVSTGMIDINIDNNPDGIVVPKINLLMPDANKQDAKKAWTAADADPIADIQSLVNAAGDNGYTFGKILMDASKFASFVTNGNVLKTLNAFSGYDRTNGANVPATLNRVNQFFTENQMPTIEIIQRRVAIEKDGIPTAVNPFEAKNIVFIPDGKLGTIKNALAVEEMNPVKNIEYATQGRILVSKWSQNEPWREYTKAECNAFPSLDAINNIFILKTEA
ncbi:Phage major capsid protein E [Cruoricaptor ignavus]|uniref:Phage major capsid protein E n=1 Tax=Cruoricaptor ignavus TaxID=1118202 RepID=A0A1M6G749_9FLAO|nr:major capsid protein [Cruoricaptor ignavus]SHJ05785.1 Phage major capsid protein E [Cruoricaptor ignavus]